MKKLLTILAIAIALSSCDDKVKHPSINYEKPSDAEYNKALEKIDLSGFSSEEIKAIKRDKPNQIQEPYYGQY